MKTYDLLVKTAAASPEKTAAICLERQLTYGELYASTEAVATRLSKLHLTAGDRVAILFENSLEYIICYFGALAADMVAVPLDTSLAAEDIKFILHDCNARVLMAQAKFQRYFDRMLGAELALELIISDRSIKADTGGIATEKLADLLDQAPACTPAEEAARAIDATVLPHELAAVFYTSGSTGEPKGVMLSHRNLISNTLATVEYFGLTNSDSVLVILPFYYIYGHSLLLTHIAVGGHVVIDNRFMYPEVVLDALEASEATGFAGVPSTFTMALAKSTIAKRKFAHLRYIAQAGGGMAPEVIKRLMAACPNQELWIMYGQTEASPRVTYLPPDRLEEKLGSIGIPVPGVRVEIVDEQGNRLPAGKTGEIIVHGPNVMLGYWNQPAETEAVIRDGWLYTGDLAKKDDDGFIFVEGRKREIIKTSGHRVSAREIEDKILELEQIAEVAVFGLPEEVLGEAIHAILVCRPGQTLSVLEVQAYCQKKMASFKVPRVVEFVEALPKYQSGKINKLELKKKFTSGMNEK